MAQVQNHPLHATARAQISTPARLNLIRVFLILVALLLELVNGSYLTAVGRETIQAYREIADFFPFNLVNPDISVADILAFLQAVLIVGVPVLVFKGALASNLFSDPVSFFKRTGHCVGFGLGGLALGGIFALELWNLREAAELSLLMIDICDPSNPLCPVDLIQQQVETNKVILKNSLKIALVISGFNMTLAAALAWVTHGIRN